jgi:flavin reductase (DIM6/NTAB) family NADH-FMN oxidoreductase RutF
MSQPPTVRGSAEDIASVLGRIPSGLFVVTWLDPGDNGDRGMLASWVMQAGFEPPSISLAVAPSRGLAAAIEAGTPFVVNLLAEGQRSMVGRFGRPASQAQNGQAGGGYDPFDGLSVERAPCGAAILAPGSGWLECVGAGGITATDHRVVVAVVRAAGCGFFQAAPNDGPIGDGRIADGPIVHLRKNGLRY